MKIMKKLYLSLLLLGTSSSLAYADNLNLKPRIEGNVRVGNERTIGMTEVWIPLMQDEVEASVLYGDLRFMDDSQDNNEGNAGLGYRKLVEGAPLGDGIAGVNIWYDRRHTDLGTNFNQITAGAEWFGEDWDAKANAYIPLNSKKTHIGAVAGTGGFTGTQIIYLGSQNITEEAMKGFDFEVGHRLPFLDSYTDSTRVYGGIYHFSGDDADDVSGYRARVVSDISEDVQLGARYQHDDERGSQGFMEATIRFPFGNKQSYKERGVRARLDESPERDIDIVSGQSVTGTRTSTVLNNATTAAVQEVFHVDNTAAGGGNGSYESPFNTLAAAQAAAGVHDIIYVHRGDGTTTGQDAGFILNDVGQKLIGSGATLTPSLLNLTVPAGIGLTSSTTLIAAGSAPSITNGAGDIVEVTADRAVVAGITANNAVAGNSGIYVFNLSGTAWNSTRISQVTTSNNSSYGVRLNVTNVGSSINTMTLDNIVSNNNGSAGLMIEASNGVITTATASNITTNNNTQRGFNILGQGNANITASVSNLTSNNNTGGGNADGFFVRADNNSNISISLASSSITGNDARGVFLLDDSTGAITADLGGGALGSTGNNSISGNAGSELRVDLDGGTLKAENNWWGVNTGLAGGETTLDAGSSVDSSPFLTSAP